MKFSATQKAAVKALILSKVGGAHMEKKYGNSLRFALQASYRFVGEDWNGETAGEGSVAFVVACALSLFNDRRAARPLEELVIDVLRYEKEDGDRFFDDTLDTIGVTAAELYAAAGVELPAAQAAEYVPTADQAHELAEQAASHEAAAVTPAEAALIATTDRLALDEALTVLDWFGGVTVASVQNVATKLAQQFGHAAADQVQRFAAKAHALSWFRDVQANLFSYVSDPERVGLAPEVAQDPKALATWFVEGWAAVAPDAFGWDQYGLDGVEAIARQVLAMLAPPTEAEAAQVLDKAQATGGRIGVDWANLSGRQQGAALLLLRQGRINRSPSFASLVHKPANFCLYVSNDPSENTRVNCRWDALTWAKELAKNGDSLDEIVASLRRCFPCMEDPYLDAVAVAALVDCEVAQDAQDANTSAVFGFTNLVEFIKRDSARTRPRQPSFSELLSNPTGWRWVIGSGFLAVQAPEVAREDQPQEDLDAENLGWGKTVLAEIWRWHCPSQAPHPADWTDAWASTLGAAMRPLLDVYRPNQEAELIPQLLRALFAYGPRTFDGKAGEVEVGPIADKALDRIYDYCRDRGISGRRWESVVPRLTPYDLARAAKQTQA